MTPTRATTPRATALGLTLLAVLASSACASPAPPAAPAAAEGQAPKTPGEQCLATARAQRARGANEPAKVSVRHVLVKYKGAKNPVAGVTRTREEACLRAMEARDKARGGADFAELVSAYSDEPGAASHQGSLGSVERRELAPPFADAAFELGPRELSDVVETESGFHLIFRYE